MLTATIAIEPSSFRPGGLPSGRPALHHASAGAPRPLPKESALKPAGVDRSDASSRRPLDGLRVLDLSRVLAGPHCARLLCDLGADVAKVEPPEGDLLRFYEPRQHSLSWYFSQHNTGKRNLSIDLSRAEGVEVVRALADHSDVLVENFRPGVMDRLGLGFEQLAGTNPRLVYASINGFGASSPEAARRAYANVIHARMGLLEREARNADRPPQALGWNAADVTAALHAVIGILAALQQRERTGRGQHVEVAMLDAMLAADDVAVNLANGKQTLEAPGDAIFEVGGEPLFVAGVVGMGSRGIFRAMRRPDLASDPRFSTPARRRENAAELRSLVGAWLAGFPDLASAEAALAAEGIATTRVYSTAEALRLPEVEARSLVREIDDRGGGTLRVIDSPWRFSEASSGIRGVAAYRGEHNREVLREVAGLDDSRIDALEASGILSSRKPG
jgi:crotonobetainyl-CoA:carnitine CoA-transferase CaiB-like acyl-CoA transferase